MQFPLATGNVLAARYLVERLLGAGGMSVVAVATDLTEGQRVAVKMLLPEAARSDAVIKRFQREQQTLQKLSSPHTVRLHGTGTEGGYPYMVLEYLEGSDLSDVLKMQGALPMPEAVEYILHACEAIAEAHSLGITHRDLKPGNLFMIRLPNGSACIKVLDFGISKLHETARQGESTLTGTAALLGSPFYMSPEQLISSRDVDARTDIWSLGVTLHELLTNTLPFGAKTTEKVCKRILNDLPTPLRQFRADMPQPLEDIILRTLKRKPKDRYPNVTDFALDLAPFAPEAAARESLAAISDFMQPTKRLRLKAALAESGRQAKERTPMLPQPRSQHYPAMAASPRAAPAPAVPAPSRAHDSVRSALVGVAMEGSGAPSGGSETTAILTVDALGAASTGQAVAAGPAPALDSSRGMAVPPPEGPATPGEGPGLGVAATGAPHLGPAGAVGADRGALGLTPAAVGGEPTGTPGRAADPAAGADATTLHVRRREWQRSTWIAVAAGYGAATFVLGLLVGLGMSGASGAPAAVGTSAPATTHATATDPEPVRPRHLDEGFDPLPPVPGDSATSASGTGAAGQAEPAAAPPPPPPATAPATSKPPAAPPTTPAASTATRTASSTPPSKPPATSVPAPVAPGVSEPPDF